MAVAVRLLGGSDAAGDLTRGRRAQLLSELAAELEARDPYTHGHSRRVARHAVVIAIRMGLPEHQVATIRAAETSTFSVRHSTRTPRYVGRNGVGVL